jgi:hypothetical protein
MPNEREPVAKKLEKGPIEWVCPVCGGWDRLCEVYYSFLPFIDHLIRDLCLLHKNPRIVGQELWYQVPGSTKLLPGLSAYDPQSPEWKELLGERRKIHSQAEVFLSDIGDWLEKALSSLVELNSVHKSDLIAAELLVSLVAKLDEEFKDQREYLLKYKEQLQQTGTDPRMVGKTRKPSKVCGAFDGRCSLGTYNL